MRLFFAALALGLASLAHAGGSLNQIAFDTDSVKLRFELIDAADPKRCASDVSASTSGLEIRVSDDATNGYLDTFTEAASTIEAITTIGSYSTPSANNVRFEIIATGSCVYEMHVPNTLLETAGANVLSIEISDGGVEIIDQVFYVDMRSPAPGVWTNPCTSPPSGSVLEQLCTNVPAVLDVVDNTGVEVADNAITASTLNADVVSKTDAGVMQYTTIATVADAKNFTLTAGSADDDAYNGQTVLVIDQSTNTQRAKGQVFDYVGSTRTVTLLFETGVFTFAAGDVVVIGGSGQ